MTIHNLTDQIRLNLNSIDRNTDEGHEPNDNCRVMLLRIDELAEAVADHYRFEAKSKEVIEL